MASGLSSIISGASSALPDLVKGAGKKIPPGGLEIDPDDIPDPPTFTDKLKDWALSMLLKLIIFIGKVISWLNDRKYMVFFVYSLYLFYKWYFNEKESNALYQEYTDYNIQGRYLDSVNHQLNIFDWKSATTVIRKQQGLNSTDTWNFDKIKKRFIIGGPVNSTTSKYALFDVSTKQIKVYSSSGLFLYSLDRQPYSDATCAACNDATKKHPTYANFKNNYILARVAVGDQLSFANELDSFRLCATYNLENVQVGPNSNIALAAGPIAIAIDGSCFYTVPSTNYTMLISNQIEEQTVSLINVPTSFCGSM